MVPISKEPVTIVAATEFVGPPLPQVLIVEAPVVVPETQSPKDVPLQVVAFPEQSVRYKTVDVFCLAKNIYHEAGIEPMIGKYAVAQITINRLLSKKHPDSICGVVLARYQFSWANDKYAHWTWPRGKNWEEAYRIAFNVLEHDERVVGLEDSDHYHADYVNPNWSRKMTEVATIGRHIFYSGKLD
jgi:spore germination cell wall hydrolase CwlJ-like protein